MFVPMFSHWALGWLHHTTMHCSVSGFHKPYLQCSGSLIIRSFCDDVLISVFLLFMVVSKPLSAPT